MDVIKKGRVRSCTTTAARNDLSFSVVTHKRHSRPEEEDDEDDTPTGGFGLRKYEGLNDLLATRPAKEDLMRNNILKGDGVSDKLTAAQEALKKKFVEDSLKQKIAQRPQANEIRNILEEDEE